MKKEQRQLLRQINKMEDIFAIPIHEEHFLTFLRTFIICDKIYQVSFKLSHDIKLTNKKYIPITKADIDRSMKSLGYQIDNDILAMIFSKQKKQGKRSCRLIRNAICHDANRECLQELEQRYDELMK